MRGWRIFNPFPLIKCNHLQKSPARSYGRLDTNIVGGLCFPSPSDSPSKPSALDISVMPVKVGGITKCSINKYLQKNLFPELEPQKPVEIVKEFKPMYTWPSKAFPFREYFTSDKLKIFIIENIVHNYEWLNAYKDKITDKHFFFIYLGCYHSEFLSKQDSAMFDVLKLNKSNFFFMCNSQKELTNLTKYGFIGDIINHNAWLDENLYSIQPTEKKYNALLIARQAKFKRHYLASKVNNLALVAGGPRHGHADQIILPPHVYNNDVPLGLDQIIEKINQSNCGLCLSKEEGACFSSSEYLLCGIPVVSTHSEGGRDFWYDDYNSIVCNDTEEAVASAVQIFLQNKRDPELIRSNHIALSKQQRARFAKVLQQVFFKHDININAFNYFKENFANKMRESYTPNFDKIFV
jgi:glycosyltransferase involved in cell wall biosynthesis